MNPPRPSAMTPAQLDALQARFALRVCTRLDEASQQLPHDITERLRVARQQAVAAWATAQQQVVAPIAVQTAPRARVWASGQVVLAQAGGHLHSPHQLGEESPGWGWRLACALPVLTLLLGLWGIHQWHQREQIQAAADVDVALLTDDLPPAAYADPGFEEFLQTAATPVTAGNARAEAVSPRVESL